MGTVLFNFLDFNCLFIQSVWNVHFLQKWCLKSYNCARRSLEFHFRSTYKSHRWSYYRVTGLKLYLFRTQIFHLRNNFMMFEIRFYILQIMTFYDISSFFDLSKAFFHKLIFSKKNFFFWFFFQKFFFKIFQFAIVINDFWNIYKVKTSR